MRNTSDAHTELLDKAYHGISQNSFLLTTFLDFSKALDEVDHEVLLKKLYYYGFRRKTSDWLRLFSSKRSHFVEINQHRSSLLDVK